MTQIGNLDLSSRVVPTKNSILIDPVEFERLPRSFAQAMFTIIFSLFSSIRQGFRTRAALHAEILVPLRKVHLFFFDLERVRMQGACWKRLGLRAPRQGTPGGKSDSMMFSKRPGRNGEPQWLENIPLWHSCGAGRVSAFFTNLVR